MSTSSNHSTYGHFSPDGREFVVTDPRPPRPWANVISNPRFGLAVSQSGSGFTWIDNSQLAVVNWWQQDFAQDTSGKFIYARDRDSRRSWSLSPAPTWPDLDHFECRHGIGYTTFAQRFDGIESEWTLFAHESEAIELWIVRLHNVSGRHRSIDLTGYLEWCCGVSPAPRREFHKLFIETEYSPDDRAIYGWSHMWDVGSKRWGHWNTGFPYVCLVRDDRGNRVGRGGKVGLPRKERLASPPLRTRRGDVARPLRTAPRPRGCDEDRRRARAGGAQVHRLRDRNRRFEGRRAAAREGVARRWQNGASARGGEGLVAARLASHRIETPDNRFDALVNDWVRYQAISARIWGRAGYYQQSGAYGFRDQLQDSQIWLTIDPSRCREQINLHAKHQFADGSVYHWWHPLSEQGLVTKMTDDLLWMSFVAPNYIRETGDFSILDDRRRSSTTKGPRRSRSTSGAPSSASSAAPASAGCPTSARATGTTASRRRD
jgi:cellobiose phosphorylase